MGNLAGSLRARHLVVVGVAVLFALLGWVGVFAKVAPSTIDEWQVIARTNSAGGLDVTEIIDLDLATEPGHGLMLRTGTEFGRPENLTVTSPDAPADVTVTDIGSSQVEIRIGDPDIEIDGQHRYVVSYSLPDAPTSVGDEFAMDLMAGSPLKVTRFRATVVGLALSRPKCYGGARYSTDLCSLSVPGGGGYSIVITDVDPGNYVTLDGVVERTFEQATPQPTGLPARTRHITQPQVGLALGVAVLVGAALSLLWSRWRGRNQVVGDGSAADAAAVRRAVPLSAGMGLTEVTDAQLGAMATTEFEPPPGIEPWEGLVLLTERFIREDVFNAYLSGLAGDGVIDIAPAGNDLSIAPGPDFEQAAPNDRAHLDALFAIDNPFTTGEYDERFSNLYERVYQDLYQRLVTRGWWSRGTPRSVSAVVNSCFVRYLIAKFAVIVLAVPMFFLTRAMHRSVRLSLVVSLAVGLLVGWLAYRMLRHARTAIGSALALRTESFRRFLTASESHQVEWAWEHGVVREYSGWAVGLGEARAWSTAVGAAARATPALAATAIGPILLHESRGSVFTSRSRPSSSSGGSSFGGSSSSSGSSSSGGSAGSGGGGSSADRW